MKLTALFMAAYMSVGALLPRTDFSQLLRLTDLAEHYRMHRAETGAGEQLSLWQFLKIHFITPDGHQHNDDTTGQAHHQLPLHSIDSSHPLMFLTYRLLPLLNGFTAGTQNRFYYLNPFLHRLGFAIFRPPIAG